MGRRFGEAKSEISIGFFLRSLRLASKRRKQEKQENLKNSLVFTGPDALPKAAEAQDSKYEKCVYPCILQM